MNLGGCHCQDTAAGRTQDDRKWEQNKMSWILPGYIMLGLGGHAAAKLLQSCLTLCDPKDGSPPGSPVPGILQARTLEWVATSFSNAWKWKVKAKSLSRVRLPATPWTTAYQAPLPMGFSRQVCWSGVPLPSPGGHGEEFNHIWSSMVRSWRKQERNMFWFSFSKDCSVQNVSYINFVITQKTKHSAGRMITPQQILARRKEEGISEFSVSWAFHISFRGWYCCEINICPPSTFAARFQFCQMAI